MLSQYLKVFSLLSIIPLYLEKITVFPLIDCSFGFIFSRIFNFFQIDCESHKQSLIIYLRRLLGAQNPLLTGKVVVYIMDQLDRELDDLDRDLIRILQQDAKKPFTQIAEELKKPDTTIHFRAERLKKNKTVTRFCALVRPEALGFTVAALLTIEIGGHILPEISKDRTRTFAAELGKEDQYLWIAVDDEPMIIHAVIMGANDQDLKQRVETIRKSPDVVKITVNPVSSVVKGWEISGTPEERDD